MSLTDKKYKVFVVDFDGTLVNSKLELSSKVKQKVLDLISDGYIFCIATGRPYQGRVREVCQELSLTFPQISSGGARIINPQTDEVIFVNYLSEDSVKKIIKYFLDHNYRFGVESGFDVFSKGAVNFEEYGPNINFLDLDQLDYAAVYKIVLFLENVDAKLEEEKLNNLYPDLHIIKGGYDKKVVFDITTAESTKYLAALKLSEILTIDPLEMVGVGDGYNDYPLLSACGYKVAMENAPKELKQLADLIVPDVNNDGLIEAFDKITL